MLDLSPDQIAKSYSSTPSFYCSFAILSRAVQFAVDYFSARPKTFFIIQLSSKTRLWYVLPHSQLKTLEPSDPRSAGHILFYGDYALLRELALSFPPDLLGILPPPNANPG